MLPREGLADEHRQRFERFAREARTTSPLYEHLSLALATDPVAQDLMEAATPAQRRPNLLFAAVHDLLLEGAEHPLARWYPTVEVARGLDRDAPPPPPPPTRDVTDLPAAAAAFTDLLRAHRGRIHATMQSRHTQTNEVGRCAVLWPGLRQATARVRQDRPLTLIELGASAGLLLHLDRYRYPAEVPPVDAGADTTDPPDTSGPTCRIVAEVVGHRPELPSPSPITRRIGVDLHPLDVDDPVDVRWLAACIWPENVDRIVRLHAATQVARHHGDVEVVRGDLIDRLPEVLRAVPDDTLPCVLHSATLAYLDVDERAEVTAMLEAEGRRRDLVWLSFEGPFLEPFRTLREKAPPIPAGRGGAATADDTFLLGATIWADGTRHDRLLARGHPHGRWVHHLDVRP